MHVPNQALGREQWLTRKAGGQEAEASRPPRCQCYGGGGSGYARILTCFV